MNNSNKIVRVMNIKTGKVREMTPYAIQQMKKWPGMFSDFEILPDLIPSAPPVPCAPPVAITNPEPVMANDSLDFVDIDNPDGSTEIETEDEEISEVPKKRGRKPNQTK